MRDAALLISKPLPALLLASTVLASPGLGVGVLVQDAIEVKDLLTDAVIFYPNNPHAIEEAEAFRRADVALKQRSEAKR